MNDFFVFEYYDITGLTAPAEDGQPSVLHLLFPFSSVHKGTGKCNKYSQYNPRICRA
jgi:hypothetical protein